MEAEQGIVQHMVCRMVSPMLTQGVVQGVVHQTVVKHVPNPTGHTEQMKSHTVPVQF